MLRKFKVSNFKNFNQDFVFDLSQTNGYEFNAECIKNGIINNSIIYGHNGTGKSNLGLAIFDVIEHLTDKKKSEDEYKNYLNAYNNSKIAEFYFEFLINGKTVKYEYKKTDYKTLVFERFCIDDKELVVFDRANGNTQFTASFKGTEMLNKTIIDNELSALKYIKNNSVLEPNLFSEVFAAFFGFIESMLYFRSLDTRQYMGFQVGKTHILDDIIQNNNVVDFEKFLNEAGIECKLSVVEELDKKTLTFDFDGKKILFREIASTGTMTLTLFYYWLQYIKKEKVSFLFNDEFDAFYHHDLSATIVKELKRTGVQFILTTHNTSIMTNEILRPDCYFLMNKKRIKSLSNCTSKELREAHNIEKMYKADSFNVE